MADAQPTKRTVKSCSKCRTRMSTRDYDSHLLCVTCRGKDCNIESRCDVCKDWSIEHMTRYVEHQASLLKKCESKERSKSSKSSHSKEESLSGLDSRADSDDIASSASGLVYKV